MLILSMISSFSLDLSKTKAFTIETLEFSKFIFSSLNSIFSFLYGSISINVRTYDKLRFISGVRVRESGEGIRFTRLTASQGSFLEGVTKCSPKNAESLIARNEKRLS